MARRLPQRDLGGGGHCSPAARGEPGGDTAFATAHCRALLRVYSVGLPPSSAPAPLAKAVSPPVSRGGTQPSAMPPPCSARPRHAGAAELRRGPVARCSLANDGWLRPPSLTFPPSARAARVPPPPCADRRLRRRLERGAPPPSSPSPAGRQAVETERASPGRKLALIAVRGHRLSRLYRTAILSTPSQCGKYSLGSGGGAPRPP